MPLEVPYTGVSVLAVPDVALYQQEEALALAGRELARHDAFCIIDQVLGGRENTYYSSITVPRDNCDVSSIRTECCTRDGGLDAACFFAAREQRDL